MKGIILLNTFAFFLSMPVALLPAMVFWRQGGEFVRRYGIVYFWLVNTLLLVDNCLTMIVYPTLNAGVYFFIKIFWLFLLNLIFLKHILEQKKNFLYFFSITVFFSLLSLIICEIGFFTLLAKSEKDLTAIVLWGLSYFWIFGGIFAGVLAGGMKSKRDFSRVFQFTKKFLLKIVFIGGSALLSAFLIRVFVVAQQECFCGDLLSVLAYLVFFIFFIELIDFLSGAKEKNKDE